MDIIESQVMSESLAVPMIIDQAAGLPVPASEIAAKAKHYAGQAKSENTRRAYQTDWLAFQAWCSVQDVQSMPASPETVLAYLVDAAGKVKVATLQRRLAAIKEAQRHGGYHLDTTGAAFRDVWKGIRNAHGTPPVQKAALLTALLRRALSSLPEGLTGIRDRALLLIGFARALRRSELSSVEASNRAGANWIEETGEGLTVHLARSKGDQEGAGQSVGIPFGTNPDTCPVRALRAWLQVAKIQAGPIFRAINRHGQIAADALSDHSVALIVKRAIVAGEVANGSAPQEAKAHAARFAGHSLRAGLATSAAANDAPGHLIQRQLRHVKFDTTVRYIQAGELFKKNAAGMAGL
jgi:integrase